MCRVSMCLRVCVSIRLSACLSTCPLAARGGGSHQRCQRLDRSQTQPWNIQGTLVCFVLSCRTSSLTPTYTFVDSQLLVNGTVTEAQRTTGDGVYTDKFNLEYTPDGPDACTVSCATYIVLLLCWTGRALTLFWLCAGQRMLSVPSLLDWRRKHQLLQHAQRLLQPRGRL